MRDWATLRAVLAGWWVSAGGHALRVAYLDARRVPGLIITGAVLVFWPLSGFTWIPIAVAVSAWLVVVWFTRRLYWRSRWRLRRIALPAIGLLTLVVLTLSAGPLAWGLAFGLWLLIAGITDTLRARRRLLAWVRAAIARTIRIDPAELHVVGAEWDGRRLTWATIDHRGLMREEDPAVRDRVANAVRWSLRHAGPYTVTWPPGANTLELAAEPPLPTAVDEQPWPELPGIPVGVTDVEHADGIVDTVDALTGDVLSSLPVLLVDPANSEKHFLVIGGTGAGKTVFTRGFIARALRMGWFPGGVFIFDGKGSSDYIVFEGREGIHCVAREPAEWEQYLPAVSEMMRGRYSEDAEYHRNHRPKPDHPRYLVVLEEVQEIRTVLGKKVLDPILQQLSRQMRASNGRLMVITQRPDAEDAIPGAVRDMLEQRIILGFVSDVGARMALGKDWQAVTDEYGSDPVPGRGVARIDGQLARIQGFRLDAPRTHPDAEQFYPPKTDDRSPGEHRSGTLPTADARWSPIPTADAAPDSHTTSQERGSPDRSTSTDAGTSGAPQAAADRLPPARQPSTGRRRTV